MLLATVKAEASPAFMLLILAVGVLLILGARAVARMTAKHPLVPSSWSESVYPAARVVVVVFGAAFVLIGAVGFVLALSE